MTTENQYKVKTEKAGDKMIYIIVQSQFYSKWQKMDSEMLTVFIS